MYTNIEHAKHTHKAPAPSPLKAAAYTLQWRVTQVPRHTHTHTHTHSTFSKQCLREPLLPLPPVQLADGKLAPILMSLKFDVKANAGCCVEWH